ncbi:uncharacterized protein LOC136768521 [Amia ocellicauda]|uniref:uncharacterized protein LOC136768521 n=1 Tax=Amia ocellicauda TaxID=2972642 RepID=UPI003464AC33
MIYCCGKEEQEQPGEPRLWMKREAGAGRDKRQAPTAPATREMYDLAAVPEQPQAGRFPPEEGRYNPGQAAEFNPGRLSLDSPQRRLGRRAPKLGEIGRSRRVVIEDEDFDDMMNNNGLFPISLNLTPVA